ncbi:MFS transporter [Terribacillus halophilus]|jgi:polyol permease family|uniref:MFS transporter n=1 Tax=Terribacillus halophilus TaxID=361279 RepID=UPI001C4DE0AC|nr:MFS transporter [Terribacillus halophilus]
MQIPLAEKKLFGMPIQIIGGLLAILLFMTGDGIEQAFLSKYVVDIGFSANQSAIMFSAYGIVLTVASWLAGVLGEVIGPKKTMLLGLITWVLFEIGFLYFGLYLESFSMMVLMYGLRGFGYPLFAFAFIVWIAYRTEKHKLATAMGWFFFMFAGGIGFLGSYYPSIFLPFFGEMVTLWSSLIWIIIGGVLGVFLVDDKDRQGIKIQDQVKGNKWAEALKGITILWESPRVAAGGLLRAINTAGWYGFVVVMPGFFTSFLDITTSQWLQLWAIQSVSNMVMGVLFGMLGDRIGWLRVVRWFGCFGAAICSLLYYYIPVAFGANIPLLALNAILFGAAIAAFVPLSAILPTLAPANRGAAISVLNLGAGASQFVGPVLVGVLNNYLGIVGVVWGFAIMYALSFCLTVFLKPAAKAQLHATTDGLAVR